MFAKVIVDVPAKQTNRSFDYIVPPELESWVDIGSRVSVPFGGRLLQGFVVELVSSTDIDEGKLKPVDQVLDLVPPLTKELVGLAKWMSQKYICHEISALQCMLPGALKAKYERRIGLADPLSAAIFESLPAQSRKIVDFVRAKSEVASDMLLGAFPNDAAVIKSLIRQGILQEQQHVKDRLSPKKVLTVFPPEDASVLTTALDDCKGARQRELIQYFLDHPEPIKLSDLLVRNNVGAGTVKSLAEKGYVRLEEAEVMRDPYGGRRYEPTNPLPLTKDQALVFSSLAEAVRNKSNELFLLHGVTGSGKTEIYMQAIELCINLGREAIVLVPEISLTPQMVERFKGRFGNDVAVLHSRLSQGERYDEWRKIARREVRVAIGARSAIFAPFTNLGLIIVDEEHESSYKQEESPKYHTRDIAAMRGKDHGAPVVLGSATPSLESYTLAAPASGVGDGRFPATGAPVRLLNLASRIEGRPLPDVSIVDMREELKEGNRSMFSRQLHRAIADRLHKQEQIVLLLNRRGYSTFVMCRSCGYTAQCPNCDVSLTYHQKAMSIRCHYCGYAEPEKRTCPDCGSEHIRYFGTGTQRVEEQLLRLFPDIRAIRMDVDTTSEKGSHEKWLNQFRDRKADVLLGTQMVAKGLDFPHVTLVGVIAADTMLHLPDFRAAEKTFQLLTQVAGRAGRDVLPGEVIVQTYAPDHYSVVFASKHDYERFALQELEQRRQRRYPPYCDLIAVTISHEQAPLALRCGERFVQSLNKLREQTHRAFYMEVFGPVAAPIPRVKNRYRFQCVVKHQGAEVVSELVRRAVSFIEEGAHENLQISIDVDPQVLM